MRETHTARRRITAQTMSTQWLIILERAQHDVTDIMVQSKSQQPIAQACESARRALNLARQSRHAARLAGRQT